MSKIGTPFFRDREPLVAFGWKCTQSVRAYFACVRNRAQAVLSRLVTYQRNCVTARTRVYVNPLSIKGAVDTVILENLDCKNGERRFTESRRRLSKVASTNRCAYRCVARASILPHDVYFAAFVTYYYMKKPFTCFLRDESRPQDARRMMMNPTPDAPDIVFGFDANRFIIRGENDSNFRNSSRRSRAADSLPVVIYDRDAVNQDRSC